MPRVAKPRLHSKRLVWFANIGEPDAKGRATEVFAPASVLPRDEAGAWKWFEAEKVRRAAKVVDPGNLTVAGICELYLQRCEDALNEDKLSAAHYTNKGLHVAHLCAALGSRPAKGLAPQDIESFLAKMKSAGYAPGYLANIAATVSAAFNWAVSPGKFLTTSPIKGFKSPIVPRAEPRFAERREAAAFLGLWRNRVDRTTKAGRFARMTMLMVRVMIRSGARPGELCALYWADLRWSAATMLPDRLVRVIGQDGVETCARVGDDRPSSGLPYAKAVVPPERWKAGGKTGRNRTIFLTPILTRALRRLHEREGRHTRNVFTHGRGRGGRGEGDPWASGSRLSATILRSRRLAIADLAQLVRMRDEPGPWRPLSATELARSMVVIEDVGANRLTNYRFRHTAISTLIMMGVDVATVAELMGTSSEMIHRHYQHLLDRHLSSAAAKLVGPGMTR